MHYNDSCKRRIYLAVADYYERKHRDADPTAGIQDEQDNDNLSEEVVDDERA